MGELTTLAPTPSIPPFVSNSTPEKIYSTLMSSDYSGRNLVNQSQPMLQTQLEVPLQSQPQLQPPLSLSSVVMQNLGNGRGENSNTLPHHNNNIVSVIPSLALSESSSKPALPFQLSNQDVNGVSNLSHLNTTNTNMGNIASMPMNRIQAPVGGVQNIMLSNAHVQTHLPPIGLLPQTPHHPVAEFLYQLTKMLTDDNNHVIEWTAGRICVHDPQKLADTVLHKYFRHSKYASFQRQLNYFGFRKIAGKGKMSPCSYVNDAATLDLRSLLFIKRKTSNSASKKNSEKNRETDEDKRDDATPTPSAESCTGNKRNMEDSIDQESAPKRQDLKKFPIPDCSSVNTNTSAPMGGTTKLDMNSSIHPAEAPLMKTPSQLQDHQKTQPISQVPVQIIPRLQNFPSQAQQELISLQPQNKRILQDSSKTVAEIPFNEQLHFPSEKSLAMMTSSKYDISSQVTSKTSPAPSIVSETPSLLSSDDSFPATKAVNELNNVKEMPFGSSLTQWQNKNSEQPLQAVSDSSDLNILKKMDGILPSWDALFPDSVNLQNACPTVSKNDEEHSAGTERVNMSSMLSRDSSLVDLAMVPTLSMLDMYRDTNNADGGDRLSKKYETTSYESGQAVNKCGKSVIG